MTEDEVIESLTGVVTLADLVRRPAERKAASSSLLDLCGLLIALRRRVEVLERQPVLRYLGIWDSDQQYPEGSLVNSKGSCWISTAENRGVQPDDNSSLWKIVARKGRDGRHAKDVAR